MSNKLSILGELFVWLIKMKKWWLLPLVIFLILLGFIVLTESSALAPMIYTLF